MSAIQRSIQRLWLKALLCTLFAYAALGKGFAYLFVGEVIVLAGLLLFVRSGRFALPLSDPVLLLWTIFAGFGMWRTVPYLSTYGVVALRDAVLWGYGLLMVFVAAFINTRKVISTALAGYRRFLAWYLPFLPVLVYASVALRDHLPVIPWSDGSTMLLLKAGDAGVHLCGAAVFALLFDAGRSAERHLLVSLHRIAAFLGWSTSIMIVLIVSRGGFVAMLIPIVLVGVWMPRRVGWKVALVGVFTAAFGLLVLATGLLSIHVKGRDFTARDVIALVVTTASGSDTAAGHEGTMEWRLGWWRNIVDDTFFGPHFWTGQGFGVNLATINDPRGLSEEEIGLRSPHDVHMTVLARMGVPGLAMWLALNFLFAARLIRSHLVAAHHGEKFWSRLYLWIFCYWLAALINATFDVYLEGPQGGIFFWSILGFGVAAMRVEAFERKRALEFPTVVGQHMAVSLVRQWGEPAWPGERS